MKFRMLFAATALAVAGTIHVQAGAQTLNVVSAGDQNMVDYVNNYLGPKFEAMNPGVKVRAVGTGPGDSGSQKIYEKLSAQQKANVADWDVDVAVVHQRGAATMVGDKLLMPYRNDIAAGKLVSRDTAKNALGANVDGYVLPMFHSQIAFAYNPELLKSPPKSFAELNDWVKKNPKQFGYNGVKGGMSGVGFVMGWVEANAGPGMADKLEKGPYDAGQKVAINKALGGLKDFNQYVVMTPGNAGTLDMLNRGEIAMGPVWVDMFYTWQADGRLSPKMKLSLPSPGLPGQPMYYVIPAKAAHLGAGQEVHRLRGKPEGSGRRHRQEIQLVSGHRPEVRAGEDGQRELEQALHRHLAVGPDELWPAIPVVRKYFTDIVEGYERVVLK